MNKRLTEKEFLEFSKNPVIVNESRTMRTYAEPKRLVGFDIQDGHLAWVYDRETGKVLFECEDIKRGRQKVQASLG